MFDTFLAHLYRGGAYAYYHTLPGKRSLWFAVEDPPAIDPAACKTNLYFSVYPTTCIPETNARGEPCPSHYARSRTDLIAAINCLYAEFDVKDYGSHEAILAHIDALTVPAPSALVNSGGGVHAYWLLSEPYLLTTDAKRQAAKYIESAWVQLVSGDKGAKDLTRILRVPGSWNDKYQPRRQVEWLRCDLDVQYPLQTLTAHLPPRHTEPTRLQYARPASTIQEFNEAHPVGSVLERFHYTWHGRHKMLSPYSSTGQAGVTVDSDTNRAFVHHGSDPLGDGYWKRPFDVVCRLAFNDNVKKTVAAIREGWS